MISRRKILSRSRDELSYQNRYNPYEDEEDVWMSKEKLYKDHIKEILNKWEQIDDEIWGKIIYMERNRRVAKAYARAPVITINGSRDGFDGYKIGLNGFDNPLRDFRTEDVKEHIGQGCRIKMDDMGNIIIKRYSRCNIYIKGWYDKSLDTSLSNEILRTNGLLESEKAVKLFDMKKFETNIGRELRSAYPDRKKLENQCISCVAFVKDAANILDLPVWIMVINIVALDMLKSKFPKAQMYRTIKVPNFVSIFDVDKQVEEDPYTLPANGSCCESSYYASAGTLRKNMSLRKEPQPPKLPPRDFGKYKKLNKKDPRNDSIEIPTPDYSQDEDIYSVDTIRNIQLTCKEDDPYYCGMQARIPKYAKPSGHGGIKGKASVRKTSQNLIRKVFSNSYINSLLPTPLTHKKRSISYHYAHYNSSESEPYTNSNDPYEVYEPIYGRIGGLSHFTGASQTMPWGVRRETYFGDWDSH